MPDLFDEPPAPASTCGQCCMLNGRRLGYCTLNGWRLADERACPDWHSVEAVNTWLAKLLTKAKA